MPADGGKGAIAGKSDAAGQVPSGSGKEGGASEKVVTGQHGADGGTVVAAGRSDAAEQPPSDSAKAVDAAKSAADVPNGGKDGMLGKDRPSEENPAASAGPALTGDYGLPLAPVAPEKGMLTCSHLLHALMHYSLISDRLPNFVGGLPSSGQLCTTRWIQLV